MKNNQISYPKKGWETYPNGGYIQPHEMRKNSLPINDWVPGQEPDWTPVPGGRGWGKKRSNESPQHVKSGGIRLLPFISLNWS